MSHRTPIELLKLTNSPNLKRALKYGPPKAGKNLAHGSELEALWTDIAARRAEALADIRRDGLVIFQDRSHAGKVFAVKIVHPALRVVTTCERQLVQLGKLLTAYADAEVQNEQREKTPLEELEEITSRIVKEATN